MDVGWRGDGWGLSEGVGVPQSVYRRSDVGGG